jgi:hypothetical protein
MSCHQRRGNAEALAAIAAITRQSLADADAAFHEAKREQPDIHHATPDEVQRVLDMISTRLGLAPAVDTDEARARRAALASLTGEDPAIVTRSDLQAWVQGGRVSVEDRPIRHGRRGAGGSLTRRATPGEPGPLGLVLGERDRLLIGGPGLGVPAEPA